MSQNFPLLLLFEISRIATRIINIGFIFVKHLEERDIHEGLFTKPFANKDGLTGAWMEGWNMISMSL